MLDRWRDLDPGQQRILTVLGSLIVVVALVSALVAVIDPGSSHVALRTDGPSSTSSSQVTTTTAQDGAATSTSTARTTSGSAGRSSTTTVRGGTTTTTKASGSAKGTTSTTAKGATTTTTRATTPTTVRTTPTTSGAACNPGGGSAEANEIANDVCADRASQGLPKLTRNSGLDAQAAQWAQTMATNGALSHNPSYSATVRADCSQCVGWAENVAYGSTAASAWSALMASRCHVANIRYGSAGEYGVGTATGGGFVWVVQDFGFFDGSPGPCTD